MVVFVVVRVKLVYLEIVPDIKGGVMGYKGKHNKRRFDSGYDIAICVNCGRAFLQEKYSLRYQCISCRANKYLEKVKKC